MQITIIDTAIRQDEHGRYSLNDLQRTNQALIECGMEFGERKERLRALMMRKHNPALAAEVLRLEA